MTDTATSIKTYSTGVEYEVLLGSLDQEIAYHITAARRIGHQTDEGAKHMDMAKNLIDIQHSISPFDEQQIFMLSTLLQDVRLNRTDCQNPLSK